MAENISLGHHAFWPTNFFRRHFEQRKYSWPYLLFVWHTVFNNLFQMATWVYAKQSSAQQ